MQRKVRYNLSKFSDCYDQEGSKILAFTLRTTDGEDETYASKRAESKGTNMTEELIRFSILSYETAPGSVIREVNTKGTPFEAFDKWSTKARNFVVAAWKKLATPDEGEIADFFESATDVE
jgi:hypothetical protein